MYERWEGMLCNRCICERRSAALYLRYLHALQAYQALNSVGDECVLFESW